MKDLFEQTYIDKLKNRRVVLFWSGGIESSCLVDAAIKQQLYKVCDITILMVTFPQELYTKQKINEMQCFLKNYPLRLEVLTPERIISHDYPYSSACGTCKTIRRAMITEYLDRILKQGSETIMITGHNLDDLASYTIELIADKFQQNKTHNRARFLECANKFHKFFSYNDQIIFYRPLAHVAKQDLQIVTEGPLKIIDKKCYWYNQRKRILQTYFDSSSISLSYKCVENVFLQNFIMPDNREFLELSYDTYLM